LGLTFADWGLPTAECIIDIRAIAPGIPLIASGGLRNGVEIAKAIALGADIAGLAWPFLQAAADSTAAVDALVQLLIAEITTVLFCTGNATVSQLKHSNALQKLA
jgi:isopentenyl-diphosphate Delta-isomerase